MRKGVIKPTRPSVSETNHTVLESIIKFCIMQHAFFQSTKRTCWAAARRRTRSPSLAANPVVKLSTFHFQNTLARQFRLIAQKTFLRGNASSPVPSTGPSRNEHPAKGREARGARCAAGSSLWSTLIALAPDQIKRGALKSWYGWPECRPLLDGVLINDSVSNAEAMNAQIIL